MSISRRKAILSTGSLISGLLLSRGATGSPFYLSGSMESYNEEIDVELKEAINLFDIEKIAKSKISHMAFEYIESGAADELTAKWNREAWEKMKLNPRILVDVSNISLKTTLLGQDLFHPILVAPTAYHKIIHTEGELGTVRGASAASAVYVVSQHTTTPLEEIKKESSTSLWFQLYIQDDREFTKDLIQKVIALGFKALCITVDTPTLGARDRQLRAKFKLPEGVNAPYMHDRNMAKLGKTPTVKKPLTWKEIEWVKSYANVPVLLKGIMNPLDAEEALKTGINGIMVSNHGGRNLDTLPATAEVFPRIVDKVEGKVPLLIDGGIRRGTDVLKAIAMGADAVLVGRPLCYGLGAGGARGVAKVLNILKTELEVAMALCGKPTIKSIDKSVLFKL